MKQFLERNKIYFEIFASLLFGSAALFVSLASYHISNQQLALNSQAQQPHFSVQTTYIRDQATGKDDDTQLFVSSISGFAYNLHCQVYSFLDVGMFTGGKRKDSLIPVIGYYPVSQHTGSSVGTLYVFSGNHNNEHLLGLADSLKKEQLPPGQTLVEVKLMNLVVIDYLDVTNVSHKAYFLDGEAIPEDKAEDYLKGHGALKPLDIGKVSAKEVLDAAGKLASR
jgi:hypothetical protein